MTAAPDHRAGHVTLACSCGAVLDLPPGAAEAARPLCVRRALRLFMEDVLVAREIATLDEAIAALQRVRDEAPRHGTAAARPGPVSVPPSRSAPPPAPPAGPSEPRLCALKTCGKLLPPPMRSKGRQRIYCDARCKHRALYARQADPAGPAPAAPAAPPTPRVTHCQLESCGKPLPPPSKVGAPRLYCGKPCIKKATRLRARPRRDLDPVPAPMDFADDGEDPTDRALRRHRELHPVPESSSGMRSRTKARTA